MRTNGCHRRTLPAPHTMWHGIRKVTRLQDTRRWSEAIIFVQQGDHWVFGARLPQVGEGLIVQGWFPRSTILLETTAWLWSPPAVPLTLRVRNGTGRNGLTSLAIVNPRVLGESSKSRTLSATSDGPNSLIAPSPLPC